MVVPLNLAEEVCHYHEPTTLWPTHIPSFHKRPEVAIGRVSDEVISTPGRGSYEDGFEAGRCEGLKDAEEHKRIFITLINDLMLLPDKLERSHGRVVLEILKAILPALAQRSREFEIRDFVSNLARQSTHGKVLLHVPQPLDKAVREAIGTIEHEQNTNDGVINIELTGQGIGVDIVASWENGGAKLKTDEVLKTCLSLIDTIFEGETRERNEAK